MLLRAWGSAVVVLLGACAAKEPVGTETGSSEAGATGTPTSGSTGVEEACPTHPAVDDCCCYTRDDDYIQTLCGVTVLCPEIQLLCTAGDVAACATEALTTEMNALVTCALEALRDGDGGRISWAIDDESSEPGEIQRSRKIDLVGDGTAFRQGVFVEDSSLTYDPVERVHLPDQAFFTDCLADTDPQRRFDCLRQAISGEPVTTCIAGFNPSSI